MSHQEDFKHIKSFIEKHFRHFNAASLKDAADAYIKHINDGNKMLVSMAGAMSTAEIGLSLAEMIRQKKVHAISCTGANLEEDIFNLVAHNQYLRIPNYRYLSREDEVDLFQKNLNRVTDTCIPDHDAMWKIELLLLDLWQKAERENARYFPYEYMYQLIRSGALEQHYQIDPKDSWVVAACENDIPIFVPGWEDSSIGNYFASTFLSDDLKNMTIMKTGTETLLALADWYQKNTQTNSAGFFQIGGGIAGDFAICIVPFLQLDLEEPCKVWSYFCQISDSTTSYGSYSGAVPNEKISWGKLGKDTPSFIIESDATIVAPLMFAYIMGAD